MYTRMLGLLLLAGLSIGFQGKSAEENNSGVALTVTDIRRQMLAPLFSKIHANGSKSIDIDTISFAPTAPRMAVGVNSEKDVGRFGQVWVAQQSGEDTILLAQMPNTHVRQILWSPDGRKLAYLTGPHEYDTQLYVVDIKTRQNTRLVASRVNGINWSPDSKSIFFWQALLDERPVYTPDAGVTWQAFRVDPGQGKPVQVSASNFRPYGAVSPDGKYLLGSSLGGDVLENLTDHHQQKFSWRSDPIHILWSPDSRWVCVTFEELAVEYLIYSSIALEISTGKQINLDHVAEKGLQLPERSNGSVGGFCWMPGKAHELLLHYLKMNIKDNFPYYEQAWLIYDLDAQLARSLPKFVPNYRGANRHITPEISVSRDARYFLAQPEQLFSLSSE